VHVNICISLMVASFLHPKYVVDVTYKITVIIVLTEIISVVDSG
jgi:hypothetical protein